MHCRERCIHDRLAIEAACWRMQEGAVYKVKVVRLMDYGAFVELPNGFQALLHISELANERVSAQESRRHGSALRACM